MRAGYNKVSSYLVCRNANNAVNFYTEYFGAQEDFRLAGPDDQVMHCEILIGDCRLMISDEFPDSGIHSPISLGGTPVSMNIYVDDVDELIPMLLKAGCEILAPLKLQFHGDKSAKFGIHLDTYGMWQQISKQSPLKT